MKQLLVALAALALAACGREPPADLIPAKIVDVRDFGADGVAVVLKGDDVPPLPIIIGHCEARALVAAMREEDFPRPLAYDLLEAMLEKLRGEVQHLVVHSIEDNTFHANLYIETEAGEWVLDCRPSDGMVLVTRLGAPIYLRPRLFEPKDLSPQV